MSSRDTTRKITYSAVCVAIALVVILVSRFTPARIVPLIIAALSFYIAFVSSGAVYGIITIAVSVTLCFFITGLGTTFLFLCIVFAPFSIVAYLLRKLNYKIMWQAIVRLAVNAAFFCLAFVVMVLLADFIADTSLFALIDRIGTVAAAVLITVATLPIDLFFSVTADRIIRLIGKK